MIDRELRRDIYLYAAEMVLEEPIGCCAALGMYEWRDWPHHILAIQAATDYCTIEFRDLCGNRPSGRLWFGDTFSRKEQAHRAQALLFAREMT
jgi:hypothetical protein